MPFHAEVMSDTQRQMLRALGPFAGDAGFFLAGGTAVALHLGHRRSIDLDWFTESEIPDAMRLAADVRHAAGGFTVRDMGRGTLHGEAGDVKLSFLEYRYPLLAPPTVWPAYGCRIAGVEDLACMKLSAISNRGARKDFIDIYALGRAYFSLDAMFGLYQRKYATEDLGHILMSLAYFDDAEEEELPEMLWNVGWGEIRQTVEGWVKDYVDTKARKGGPGLRDATNPGGATE